MGENGRKGWNKPLVYSWHVLCFYPSQAAAGEQGLPGQEESWPRPPAGGFASLGGSLELGDGFPGNMDYDSAVTVFFETFIDLFIFMA